MLVMVAIIEGCDVEQLVVLNARQFVMHQSVQRMSHSDQRLAANLLGDVMMLTNNSMCVKQENPSSQAKNICL
jgi:hypothetical protein